MISRHSKLRTVVVFTLIASMSGLAICSAGGPAMAGKGHSGNRPVPADRLPCKCDMSEEGCCCGASCCCNHAMPKEAPAAPDEGQEQRTLRQPLVLQILVHAEAQLFLGRSVDAEAPTTLVVLTPTLQLEHVRIQT